jgi:hypothetical protein
MDKQFKQTNGVSGSWFTPPGTLPGLAGAATPIYFIKEAPCINVQGARWNLKLRKN